MWPFTYDPIKPFISLGGTYLGVGVGPAFQNPNNGRKDQIVFESEPLSEPMVLLGPIEAAIGILMFGWSTAMMVAAITRIYGDHLKRRVQELSLENSENRPLGDAKAAAIDCK